jgi:hypothetical protein
VSIDRPALIEAAEAAERAFYRGELTQHGLAECTLDAVLPLVADAIEAAPIPFTKDRERMDWGHGVRCVMAELVRGLATRTGDDDA